MLSWRWAADDAQTYRKLARLSDVPLIDFFGYAAGIFRNRLIVASVETVCFVERLLIKDVADIWKPSKKTSWERIVGIVALVTALDLASRDINIKCIYSTPGN